MTGKSESGNRTTVLLLLFNVIIIFVIALMFSFYSKQYKETLNDENLNNIGNLNESASNIVSVHFRQIQTKLEDIVTYASCNNFGQMGMLEYIYKSTAKDSLYKFQLIGEDSKGYMAEKDDDGNFININYTFDTYGALKKIFSNASNHCDGTISYAPEFTDQYTALRSFAMYTNFKLLGDDGQPEYYTLLAVSKSKSIFDVFNLDGGYENMSSALMDSKGNYIISNSNFPSDNFFDYLYHYNDLSLDKRNELYRVSMEKKDGELYYKNNRGEQSVFLYHAISGSNDWYCVTMVPLNSFHVNSFGNGFVGSTIALMAFMLIIDVSWLAAVNKRLKQSVLREKEANNAKTDFLSRMSHDIRTPLNGIIGTTILAMDEQNPPQTAEYLRLVESNGKFLLGLVNDVLDMSKVESGKMDLHLEPYSFSELREYIEAIIEPLCKTKNIELVIDITDDGRPLLFDKLRLNQICFNLLSNSVKFSPEDGRVEFHIEKRELSDTRAAVTIVVSDNGIGMSEEYQHKHMFEAFAQEKRMVDLQNPGTGLGLAIVNNLVKLMNGTINVKSKLNEGTSFTIFMEADFSKEIATDNKDRMMADDNVLNGRHVLLCEDVSTNILVACKMLEKKGVTVDVANNGRIGVEMFEKSEAGYYDAILMDLMMPELDGYGATHLIRGSVHKDAVKVPIIAMTANAYASDIKKCLESGMNSHIAKPIDPNTMFSELARYISNYRNIA